MMKVCYVVSASGWDQYAQMACVSASVVKRWHPHAQITVLADEITFSQWRHAPNKLLETADHVIAVDTGNLPSAGQRSRFIKTSMRQYIEGDFLFLDVDTLPLGPLEHLLTQSEPLGAALELNKDIDEHFFPHDLAPLYERLHWRHPAVPYFNSGVLVVRDCQDAYQLFLDWHSKWKLSVAAGVYYDQPALNSALFEGNYAVRILSPSFNAMISYFYNPWLFRGAHIAHFFAANPIGGTLLFHLTDHLVKTGSIDWEMYDQCRREGHPWAHGGEPWQLWKSRNYVRAVSKKITRFAQCLKMPFL
ncbi:MAG: hypothetical protein AB7N91_21180 [Candidatus Tectimicrobiota bacterium]